MQSTSPRLRLLAYIGLCVIALAMAWWFRAPLHAMPLERDEGAYAIIAVQWQAGEIPYRDLFDHKPPLVYQVYQLAQLVPGDGVTAIRSFATLYLLLSGVALLGLGMLLYGRRSALAALVLFLAYGSSLRFQGITFNSEAVMTLPAILACLCVAASLRDRRLLLLGLGGVLAGLATLAKPVGGVLLPAFGLTVLCVAWPWPRRIAGVALLAAGALLPVSLFGLYFWYHNALPAVWAALWDYNRLYVHESRQQFSWGGLVYIGRPMLVLAVPGLLGLLLSLTRREGRTSAHVAAVGWGLSLGATALLGMRAYPHYYLAVVPALCLWGGAGVGVVADWVGRGTHRLIGVGVALALLAVLITPVVREVWPLRSRSPAEQAAILYKEDGLYRFGPAVDVAAYLKAQTAADEPIFVWASEPQIYYLADRQPATRFVYDYPVDRLPGARGEVLTQVHAHPPRFIVTYAGVRPEGIDSVLREHDYRLLEPIGGFDIFEHPSS